MRFLEFSDMRPAQKVYYELPYAVLYMIKLEDVENHQYNPEAL